MAKHNSNPVGAASRERPDIEAVPDTLLDSPLDYIFADHFRHRQLCGLLTKFATDGVAGRREATAVMAFLEHDLPLHHKDEEDDLFPALKRRARQEDELSDVIEQLSDDHDRSESQARIIRHALANDDCSETIRLDGAARAAMRRYAGSQHRHLALENGILLTIARIRLTKADLSAMSQSMKSRHGVAA
jgi:iron-sulfur cluster repair protein YtfE (RIC family)